MERARLEQLLAEGYSLERIGRVVGKHPATVGYWVKQHGLTAAHRDQFAPKGRIAEHVLRHLVERGLAVAAIARELERSVSTVRYWLERYGLQTAYASRTSDHRRARTQLAVVDLTCGRHGKTSFTKDNSGRYRCARCNSEGVSRRRRKMKQVLVREAGGACALCGYDRYQGALQFHHLDRGEKLFAMGHDGNTRSLARARSEARKCLLVRANCHAEVEAGVANIGPAADKVSDSMRT